MVLEGLLQVTDHKVDFKKGNYQLRNLGNLLRKDYLLEDC